MKKRNRSITADLTPLLDVIFILLFLILIRNAEAVDAKAAEAEEKIAEAQAQIAEAEALQENVQERLTEYESLLADAEIFYISILPEETGRTLQVIRDNSTESFHFDWDSTEAAWQFLQESVETKVGRAGQDKQVFLVFTYDGNKLYQSDFEMVSEVLNAAGHNENVFVQYRETEQE